MRTLARNGLVLITSVKVKQQRLFRVLKTTAGIIYLKGKNQENKNRTLMVPFLKVVLMS